MRKRTLLVSTLGIGALAVVGAAGGGLWWLSTEAGGRFVSDRIEDAVAGALTGGAIEVGSVRLRGRRLVVEDVVVDGVHHDDILVVPRIEVVLEPGQLLSRRIAASQLKVERPRAAVHLAPDGTVDLPAFAGAASSTSDETTFLPAGWGLDVERVRLVDGGVEVPSEDLTVDRIHLAAGTSVGHTTVDVADLGLSARVVGEARVPLALSGRLSLDGEDLTHVDASLTTVGATVSLRGRSPGLLGDAPKLEIESTADVVPAALGPLLVLGEVEAELPEVPPVRVALRTTGAIVSPTLTVEAGWRDIAAPVAVASGRAELSGEAPSVDAVVEVPALTGLAPLAEGLTGSVRVRGTATLGQSPTADLQVRGTSLGAGGVRVARLEGPLWLEGSRASANVEVVGLVAGDGIPPSDGAVQVDWAQPRLAADVSLVPRTEGPLRVDADADWNIETGALHVEPLVLELPGMGRWEAPRPVDGVVTTSGVVRDLDATLREAEGEGMVSAQIRRIDGDDVDASVRWEVLELGPAAELVATLGDAELPRIAGVARGRGAITLGDAEPPMVRASVAVDGLTVDGAVQDLQLEVEGRIRDDAVAAELSADHPEDGRVLRAELRSDLAPGEILPACGTEATLAITSDGVRWERAAALAPMLPERPDVLTAASVRSLTLTGEGDPCAPELALDAVARVAVDGEPVRLRLEATDGPEAPLSVEVEGRVDGQTRARMQAEVVHAPLRELVQADEPELGGWRAELDLLGLPTSLAPIEDTELQGRLYGEAMVSGAHMRIAETRGAATWERAAIGDTDLRRARLRWRTEPEHLSFAADAAVVEDAALHATGSVGRGVLDGRTEGVALTASVARTRIPLEVVAALAGSRLVDAAGELTVAAEAGGTLDAPTLDGTVEVRDGAVTVTDTGVHYSDIELLVEATASELVVREATLSSRPRYGRFASEKSGTDLTLDGRIAFTDEGPSADLHADAQQLWLSADDRALAEVSGPVTVSGTWPELTVGGDVSVVDGRFDLDRYLFIPPAAEQLHDDIAFVGETPEVFRAPSDPDQASVTDATDVQMSVDAGRGVELEATVPLVTDLGVLSRASDASLDASVQGEVDVDKQDDDLELEGSLETTGSARLMTASFDVEQGVISFSRGSSLMPVVDLTLTRDAGTWGTVTAQLSGTPSDLTIDQLSSTSELSQSDLMALLLFGRPLSALEPEEASSSSAMVQNALLAVAGSGVEEALGVEVADEVSYSSTSGLSVGWALGDDAFVTVSLDPTADEEENLTEVELSWFLSPVTSAELRTGDAAESSAWLEAEHRF